MCILYLPNIFVYLSLLYVQNQIAVTREVKHKRHTISAERWNKNNETKQNHHFQRQLSHRHIQTNASNESRNLKEHTSQNDTQNGLHTLLPKMPHKRLYRMDRNGEAEENCEGNCRKGPPGKISRKMYPQFLVNLTAAGKRTRSKKTKGTYLHRKKAIYPDNRRREWNKRESNIPGIVYLSRTNTQIERKVEEQDQILEQIRDILKKIYEKLPTLPESNLSAAVSTVRESDENGTLFETQTPNMEENLYIKTSTTGTTTAQVDSAKNVLVLELTEMPTDYPEELAYSLPSNQIDTDNANENENKLLNLFEGTSQTGGSDETHHLGEILLIKGVQSHASLKSLINITNKNAASSQSLPSLPIKQPKLLATKYVVDTQLNSLENKDLMLNAHLLDLLKSMSDNHTSKPENSMLTMRAGFIGGPIVIFLVFTLIIYCLKRKTIVKGNEVEAKTPPQAYKKKCMGGKGCVRDYTAHKKGSDVQFENKTDYLRDFNLLNFINDADNPVLKKEDNTFFQKKVGSDFLTEQEQKTDISYPSPVYRKDRQAKKNADLESTVPKEYPDGYRGHKEVPGDSDDMKKVSNGQISLGRRTEDEINKASKLFNTYQQMRKDDPRKMMSPPKFFR